MRNEIDNSQDVLDSRDIIARIETLESELQDACEAEGNVVAFDEWLAAMAENDRGTEQEAAQELIMLRSLASDGEGYADDWNHGVPLIRDSYFKEYAQQFADDIGAVPSDVSWPMTCIDWDQAASELQQDYTALEFGDVTYWVQ